LMRGGDGNFYGTTSSGGAYGYGTVFQLTTNLVLTTFVSFDGTNFGSDPQGPLVQRSDGNYYGTAQSGGPGGCGTVFSVSPLSNAPTIWVIFNQTNGAYPNGGLALSADGNLYGTTSQGGVGGAGTVFRVWPELNFTNAGNSLVVSWSTDLPGSVLQSTTPSFVPGGPTRQK